MHVGFVIIQIMFNFYRIKNQLSFLTLEKLTIILFNKSKISRFLKPKIQEIRKPIQVLLIWGPPSSTSLASGMYGYYIVLSCCQWNIQLLHCIIMYRLNTNYLFSLTSNCLIVTVLSPLLCIYCYMADSQDDVRVARGGILFGKKPNNVALTTAQGLSFSFACSSTQYSKSHGVE